MLTDQWPYNSDLSLDECHIVWMFSPTTDSHVSSLVVFGANDPPRHFKLHCRIFLVFACFELEYWQAMDTTNAADSNDKSLKMRMLK